MRGFGRAIVGFTFTAALAVLSSEPGLAGASITVGADHARVVSVAGTPSAVVVGNPMFADVSVQQGVIIVHGRNFAPRMSSSSMSMAISSLLLTSMSPA